MNDVAYKKIFRDAMKEKNISVYDVSKHFGKPLETIENWLCGISQPLKIVDRVTFCEYFGIEYFPGLFAHDDAKNNASEGCHISIDVSVPTMYISIVDMVKSEVSLSDFVEFLNIFKTNGNKSTDLAFDILSWCYGHTCYGTYTRVVIHLIQNNDNFRSLFE